MTSHSPDSCTVSTTPPTVDGDADVEVLECTPFKPTESLGSDVESLYSNVESLDSDAIMRVRAERLSRALEKNMVDCKEGDICDELYNELVSELPMFNSVHWDDIAKSLQAHTSTDGDNPWSVWLTKSSQGNFDKVLQVLCDMVHNAVKDTVRDRPLKRVRFVGNKSVQSSALGNTSTHPPKPDFVTIEEPAREGQGWRHYETLWEHKSSGDGKESDDLICRLIVRLFQAVRDCPFRRFAVGVVVQQTKFRPIIVDASGGCRFLQTDIVQETAKFLRFVASLLFLSRPYIGYNNDSIPKEESHIPLSFEDCHLLADQQPLAYPTRDHIVGRGTHVYRARPRDTPLSEPLLMVKDCWQEVDREKEEDILQGLKGVGGVPPLLYRAAPDRFDTTIKIRRGFDTYVQYHFTQQGYAERRGGSKHGTSSTHNTSEGKEDMAKGKRKRQESHVMRKRSRQHDNFLITARRHCRIVTPYCGAHLDATHHSDGVPMTDVERLRAMRDVLNTIKDAFLCDQPTIQRDISLRNITVWRLGRPHPYMDIENKQIGFITDWDMGKTVGPDWKPLNPSSGLERTGTWYYIATSICQQTYDGHHLPWYDAESVFWVWLILVMKRVGHWEQLIQALEGTATLTSMCGTRNQIVTQDFWADFSTRPSIHPSVRKLLSDLRLELFFDQGRGPTFKYQASRWSQTKENVSDRLEYLAGLFNKCASELEGEHEQSAPQEG